MLPLTMFPLTVTPFLHLHETLGSISVLTLSVVVLTSSFVSSHVHNNCILPYSGS